ncbi:LicD family-domain-containing protein [Xylariaceae sp. FL1651]|nr:LicD family-domain-containing protein [Xylariaceae sp. FL1651]
MGVLRPILLLTLVTCLVPIATAAAVVPETRGLHGNGRLKGSSKSHETKYFHEPGGDLEFGHYDTRYFQGKVPYDEHRPALQHLVRSYLTTFSALGIETWLAHGSLLGWWWNGRIMPWDYDLDVQVSVATLHYLGKHFNRSTHEYVFDAEAHLHMVRSPSPSEEKPQAGAAAAAAAEITKTYLLDINPHHSALTKGNGANVIDARWIDTSSGMFIDITGLREREPERAPGVWSCKNNHRYRTPELWPLRRTQFEGVDALIPYAFDKILTDEYGAKSLVATEWAGHQWVSKLKEWVRVPKSPKKDSSEKPHRQKIPGKKEKKGDVVVVYEEVIVSA